MQARLDIIGAGVLTAVEGHEAEYPAWGAMETDSRNGALPLNEKTAVAGEE